MNNTNLFVVGDCVTNLPKFWRGTIVKIKYGWALVDSGKMTNRFIYCSLREMEKVYD